MWGRDRTSDDDFKTQREQMVDALVEANRIQRRETVEAMKTVPRHEFVPESKRTSAYADRPLPIGNDQTVSAPHMVGMMCDLLELSADETVLEIGTGCGYHAAVTTEIVGDGCVYTVEYVRELGKRAADRLDRLGYDVHVRIGDGHQGWPAHAPFDHIYITCAPPAVPDQLLDQLQTDGYLLAPVGRGSQRLVRVSKTPDGPDREDHGPVRFVPMKANTA